MDNVNEMIKYIRKQKGYTQEYIANQLGISLRSYSKIENGETNLSIKRLSDITKILEIDLPDLFTYSENKPITISADTNNDINNELSREDYILQIKHYLEVIELLKEHNKTLKKMLEFR